MNPRRYLNSTIAWTLRNRYAVVFLLLAVFYFAYLTGVRNEASVFGDGAGKWVQIQGLIAQDFQTLQCDHDSEFDPDFRWLAGPWYFYHVTDGDCFYGYQYPYAIAVAPFVKFFPDYGYYLLNFLFLVLFVFFTMRIAGYVCIETPEAAEFLMGLTAFLVIPSPTFAYDLSEVIMALAMVTGGLWFTLRGAGFRGQAIRASDKAMSDSGDSGLVINTRLLIAGGFLTALVFALRTETAMYLATTCGALAMVAAFAGQNSTDAPVSFLSKPFLNQTLLNKTVWARAIRLVGPYAGGALIGIGCVVAFHLLAFGNLAGNRGSTHAALVFFDFDFARQFDIARILLFGGSLGLFSSLPSIALAGLWLFFSGVRKATGRAGTFLILASLPYICLVLITAPNDAGYSWSPRYLAFVFVPLYLVILMTILRWPAFRRWYTIAPIVLLFMYGVHFTHTGMKILQRTSKQNLQYAQAIQTLSVDVLVIDIPPAIGFLSEEILNQKRIYMAQEPADADALMLRLAAAGVNEFIYIRTPLGQPILQLTMPVKNAAADAKTGQATKAYRSVRQVAAGGMQLHVMRLSSGDPALDVERPDPIQDPTEGEN